MVRKSRVIETKPLGALVQPDYLNMLIEVKTDLQPLKLLACCQKIEKKLGRVREKKWDSRTIDIDIIFYANERMDLPDLQIPHPGLLDREFLQELFVELGVSWKDLLEHLQ